MHWTSTPAKTKDVLFTSVSRPIQNPVPGTWLSLSHVNRSFFIFSKLLSPSFSHHLFHRFLSWKLDPSSMKISIAASVFSDGTQNTQKSLTEICCPQTTTIMKQSIIQAVRADLVKGAENSQKRLQALSLYFPLGNTSSGAPGPIQHFFCDKWFKKKKKCLEKPPKRGFKFGIWQIVLWFPTLETLFCRTSVRSSLLNQSPEWQDRGASES